MEHASWKSRLANLNIVRKPGTKLIRPKQTDLSRFENEFNFDLPTSYKSFIREMGPGMLGGYFFVLAPTYEGATHKMQQGIRRIRKSDVLAATFGKDLVSRILPFGGSTSGDIFAWDPTQRHGGDPFDYKILALPRSSGQVIWVAEDFRSFVVDSCLRGGYFDALGYVLPDSKPEWSFEPEAKRIPKAAKATGRKGTKKRAAPKSRSSPLKGKAKKKLR